MIFTSPGRWVTVVTVVLVGTGSSGSSDAFSCSAHVVFGRFVELSGFDSSLMAFHLEFVVVVVACSADPLVVAD